MTSRSPTGVRSLFGRLNRSEQLKRGLDVAGAGAGLVLGAPVLLGVAAAIKADDPSAPVLFTQTRVGRGGREFLIHKFRTMTPAGTGPQVTSENDDRITGIGRLLRSTKLDELPQLFDVLTGAMSLVGPRPEVPKYVAHWGGQAASEILSVRPGITDPAAIIYRHEQRELAEADDPEVHYLEQILPKKVALYRDYVRNHTICGDLAVLARTVLTVVKD